VRRFGVCENNEVSELASMMKVVFRLDREIAGDHHPSNSAVLSRIDFV
jgi:hypothetical protein